MESKQPRLVKLFDEDDETIPDRVAYASFAMQALDLKGAHLIWLEQNGEYSIYLYDPTLKKEEVQKLAEQGCYIDFTPNEERLKYFKPYLNLLKTTKETKESVAQLLKEALRKLK